MPPGLQQPFGDGKRVGLPVAPALFKRNEGIAVALVIGNHLPQANNRSNFVRRRQSPSFALTTPSDRVSSARW